MRGFIICYLAAVNLVAFFLMYSDKRRAVRRQWRIPEKTFFALSFFGGAAGALAGMFLFRHKTRHLSFRIILPLCLILNIAAVCWLFTGELI